MKILKTILLFYSLFLIISCKDSVPSDFNFSLSFNSTEHINTFDATYKREYNFHDTVIELTLTINEKEKIFSVMNDNDIMKLPGEFEPRKGGPCVVPSSRDYLTVQFNSTRKKIEYSFACEPNDPKASNKYLKIRQAIIDIIQNRQEIKKLPESDMIFL